MIHKELNLENIFINGKMNIKIDFDISKQFNQNKEYIKALNVKGSIEYMAPEILIDGKYDEKSDMY